MGCGSGKPVEVDNPNKIKDVAHFQISSSGMVAEKQGSITNEYTLLKPPIGKGAFGEVRKAIHKVTNQIRAVKVISKEKASKDHPNIIKIYEFYQDHKNIYIVTELCTGGELFDKIQDQQAFSERKAAETMKQVLSAVNYLHKSKIVHRDLKPENILYEANKPQALLKIVDFGTSRVFETGYKMNQKLGTPYYIAPEVLERKYDENVMYGLVDEEEILENVKEAQLTFDGEEWNQISYEAKLLIKNVRERSKKRISAEQAQRDPWITTYVKKTEMNLPQLTKVLNNLRNFRVEKFQEAALTFMVNQMTTSQEKQELLQQFQALDLNGDGRLSKEELVIGYSKVMSYTDAELEVTKLMKYIDQDKNGSIDYSEFVLATFNKVKLIEDARLEQAFKMFDKDGSGSISIDEIKGIFGSNEAAVSDDVWKELLAEVDANGDGSISFQEFKEIIIKAINANNPDQKALK